MFSSKEVAYAAQSVIKMGGETTMAHRSKSDYPKLSAKPVGKKIANLYRDRISQFYGGGQYEKKNLLA